MVRPPFAVVSVGIADVRSTPDARSELVDQVHFQDGLHVLAERSGWLSVQVTQHQYFGWIRAEHVTRIGAHAIPLHVVSRALAPVRERPDGASNIVDHIPAGTTLVSQPGVARFVHGAGGWVSVTDCVLQPEIPLREPTVHDLLATARAFLDVPYLWGGTSARGLDCSGFVQLAYRLCGVLLMRDADQQVTQGRPVEEARRAGDLLFFGTPVTHVGMSLDETRMIHAAGGGIGRVVEQAVSERGAPVSIRRYLP